ncbi:MAG: carboxymuconolactone decarboxylase family protein [Bacteroidota bacterium]
MKNLEALSKDQVNDTNASIFDDLKSKLNMVPNLYATIANSGVALKAILEYGNTLGGGELSGKEAELIALTISQMNSCHYCLAAHTALGKMNGFSEDDTKAIRNANYDGDAKLKALATLTKDLAENKGHASEENVKAFYDAGYSKGALVEVVGFISMNVFNNYVNNFAGTDIDFPKAPEL